MLSFIVDATHEKKTQLTKRMHWIPIETEIPFDREREGGFH
jgi:hypothetical protein